MAQNTRTKMFYSVAANSAEITHNEGGLLDTNPATNLKYYSVVFVNSVDGTQGVGLITHGVYYKNTPYWIEVVDELPATVDQKPDTIYMVRE